LFGARSLGPSSYTMPVGLISFYLFDAFDNNAFLSVFISVGDNPGFGQHNLVQGTIPTQGASTTVFSSQGLCNPWKVLVPLLGMMTRGNPFHGQWNPRQGSIPILVGSTRGNPLQNIWNTTKREIPTQPSISNYGNQSMMSQQT
jgi:hypothetical protein